MAMAIQAAFVAVEVGVGVGSRSLAVLADAGHNVSDALALALAWGAAKLAEQKASKGRTYGLRSASILAAVVNALTLLVVNAYVAWEAIARLKSPEPVAAIPIIVVSLAGVVVNAFCARLVAKGQEKDLNVRAAFLHLASDAAVAGAVAVTGIAIRLTGLAILDPIASLLVAALVLYTTWPLLRRAIDLALQAVPAGIDEDRVRALLLAAPGVVAVRDLHIWALSTTETALTAHVVATSVSKDDLSRTLGEDLRAAFVIHHITLQVEPS